MIHDFFVYLLQNMPAVLIGAAIGLAIGMVVMIICSTKQYDKGYDDGLMGGYNAGIKEGRCREREKRRVEKGTGPDIMLHAMRNADLPGEVRQEVR